MRRLALTLLAVASLTAVVGGTTVATAGSASAETDHRPCVSQAEFRSVHRGMSQAQVNSIFDSHGSRIYRYAAPSWWDSYYGYWHAGVVNTVAAYNKCPGWGVDRVGVHFSNYTGYGSGMRVWTKRGGDAWGLADWVYTQNHPRY